MKSKKPAEIICSCGDIFDTLDAFKLHWEMVHGDSPKGKYICTCNPIYGFALKKHAINCPLDSSVDRDLTNGEKEKIESEIKGDLEINLPKPTRSKKKRKQVFSSRFVKAIEHAAKESNRKQKEIYDKNTSTQSEREDIKLCHSCNTMKHFEGDKCVRCQAQSHLIPKSNSVSNLPVTSYKCTDCKVVKSNEEFYKSSYEKRGYNRRCKSCDAIKGKAYQLFYTRRVYRYKKSAEVRGLEFSLTDEEFKELWKTPCHFCRESIKTIGIDRKDNKKGYSRDNVIPCCKICNYMKRDMMYDDFMLHCNKISGRVSPANPQNMDWEKQIYDILYAKSSVDGVRVLYEDEWPIKELVRLVHRAELDINKKCNAQAEEEINRAYERGLIMGINNPEEAKKEYFGGHDAYYKKHGKK